MTGDRRMSLTAELVALCFRDEQDLGPDPHRPLLSDAEFEAVAERIFHESKQQPLWIFAYGSLIWKPDFDAVESRRAIAQGWHRSFCLRLNRWRGTPEQPGLMMALDRGGSCAGMAYRLPDNDRLGQIRRLLRREIGSREGVKAIRWITVETDQGYVRALVFWAGPKGEHVSLKLPLATVARVLARACGHIGSCAEYLYLTVLHLEQYGIRDRNLWQLQELVACEIRSIHRLSS
ncbi:cation transporter ChaC-like protein (plasmid) [Rhizobium gallicum bv. gallicum R602sp]|uniref:glutathione-specific gamma-glutamylcyclotransferase n=1 Tax=Rhizobium gallicum bv. gallicum R602sp TaxID=1041138 RepID=A0A0B4X896_9HYPH|nr:gamma-glutamylcyclotransferase [Rhizobium gallicum]AJD44224.1 cation transporter ChaC-like protein [Rhizobium gallicum bv. gallicum R602sp]TDW25586.1 cation transport protein ChaC [Rhizobium azibense]